MFAYVPPTLTTDAILSTRFSAESIAASGTWVYAQVLARYRPNLVELVTAPPMHSLTHPICPFPLASTSD